MTRKVISVLKITVSIGLVIYVYKQTPLSEIRNNLQSINVRFLPFILLLFLSNTFISSVKWHLFLKADGFPMAVLGLMKNYLIATFFNIFLPSNIGGDVYRIYSISKESKNPATSVVSVLSDRLSGFLAIVILALIAALVIFFKVGNTEIMVMALSVFILLLLCIALFFYQKPIRFLLKTLHIERRPKLNDFVEKFLAVFSVYRNNRALLAKVMIISLVFQLTAIVCVRLMAVSLDIHVPFIYFCAFIPLITLIEAVPISIYGIGIRDLGYVYFFGKVGMTEVETRALALLYLSLTLTYSLLGGVLFFYNSWKSRRFRGRGSRISHRDPQ